MFRVLITNPWPGMSSKGGGGVSSWAMDMLHAFRTIGQQCWYLAPGNINHVEEGFVELPETGFQKQADFIKQFVLKKRINVILNAGSFAALLCYPALHQCLRLNTVHRSKPFSQKETEKLVFADALICVSESSKNSVVSSIKKHYGTLYIPIFSIPNGISYIPEHPLYWKDRNIDLIYVGRLRVDEKRAHWLPRIFTQVQQKYSSITMTIIGNGHLTPFIRKLEKRYSNNVSFYERLNHEKVLEMLKRSKIYLMPSEYEGLSIGMLEAMASGCAIVSGDSKNIHGGVLNQETAMLVPALSGLYLDKTGLQVFRNAACKLMANPSRTHEIGSAAHSWVKENHHMSKVASDYIACFHSMKDKKRKLTFKLAFNPKGASLFCKWKRKLRNLPYHIASLREQVLWTINR